MLKHFLILTRERTILSWSHNRKYKHFDRYFHRLSPFRVQFSFVTSVIYRVGLSSEKISFQLDSFLSSSLFLFQRVCIIINLTRNINVSWLSFLTLDFFCKRLDFKYNNYTLSEKQFATLKNSVSTCFFRIWRSMWVRRHIVCNAVRGIRSAYWTREKTFRWMRIVD